MLPSDGGLDALGSTIVIAGALSSPQRCGEAVGPSLDEGEAVRTAVALADGRLLVSGLRHSRRAWTGIIDPTDGTRTPVDMPHEAMADRFHRLGDGRVLGLGHALLDDPFSVAARYDPAASAWTVLPAPPRCLIDDAENLRSEYRVTLEVAELPGGDVLVVGHRCSAYLVSSRWLMAPKPLAPRRGFTLTTLRDGDVLRVGGLETMPRDFDLERSGGVERFDVKRRRWRRVASMSYTRHAHTSTLRPDGTVVVVGGCEGAGPVCNSEGPSPPVEIYDPATDRWKVAGAAPITDRTAHTATLLGDGRIVVLGGHAKPDYSPRPTLVLDGDRWFEAPAPAWRLDHTAVLVGDRILLAGPLNHEFSPPLAWYGIAADCPTTEVRLGRAQPPEGPAQ